MGKGLKRSYEFHHGVTITDEALITANRLSHRYISDRCLPDKAIDLIDEASAQVKIESTSKPKIIEEKESQINHLDSLIQDTNEETTSETINDPEEQRELMLYELSQIKQQW